MNRKLILGLGLAVFAGSALAAEGDMAKTPTVPALPADPSSLPLPKDPLNPGTTPSTNPSTLPNADSLRSALGSFGSIDTNGDGSITKLEAKPNASLTGQFGKLDVNGDGKLSQDEFKTIASANATQSNSDQAKVTAGATAFPKNLDTNKDNKLSKEEVQGNTELFAQFETIDTNGDGSITNREFRISTKDLLGNNAKSTSPSKSAKDKAQDKRDEVKDKLN